MLYPVVFLLLGVAITITLYYLYIYIIQQWRLRKFKGPLALPFIGNCYDPKFFVFFRYIGQLRRRYGKVFKIFAFSRCNLVVTDPIVVRRVLSDNTNFYKGDDYSKTFNYVFGEGLVTSNGEKHRKDKQIFSKYFIRSNVLKYTKKINHFTKKTIDEMVPKDGSIFNVEHLFAIIALRNFMQFSISSDISDDYELENHLASITSRCSHLVGKAIIYGISINGYNPMFREITEFLNLLRERIFEPSLSKRQNEIAEGKQVEDDCLTAMIESKMNLKDCFDHFVTLISAGHDTTAFFLSYMIYLLANNPEAQEKLYAALSPLFDKDEFIPEEILEVKYLTYVMMETLRFYAIIPALTRVAADDVHIKEANITIPKDTIIFVPMLIINRDPEIWEEPAKFNPDRFENKTNEFTSAKDGFFPFGYGSRTCIGNTFAQIESAIVICHLLKNYTIHPDPSFKPVVLSGISLTTSNGINVALVPRKK